MTLDGSNFGTNANTDIKIIFRTRTEKTVVDFVVPPAKFLTRTHTKITFPVPEGYGASVDVLVSVRGQTSVIDPTSTKFSFSSPVIDSIAPKCGENYDCFGFQNPGFPRVSDYPKIISIITNADGTSTVQLSLSKPFPLEVDMQIQLQGMSQVSGLQTNSPYSFDGTWKVLAVKSSSSFTVASNEKEKARLGGPRDGLPTPDTYLGFNNPAGNLRALASRTQVHARSGGFNMLETDGCQTYDKGGTRGTGWETYDAYASRLSQADASDGPGMARQCAEKDRNGVIINNTQTIFINGSNFGSTSLGTPITVLMKQKKCDCSVDLDGTTRPCKSDSGDNVCYAKDSSGECPTETTNCDLDPQ